MRIVHLAQLLLAPNAVNAWTQPRSPSKPTRPHARIPIGNTSRVARTRSSYAIVARGGLDLAASDARRRLMLQQSPMYSYIPVRDLARARAFYEGKLGWKPTEERAAGIIYRFADHTACFMYKTPYGGTSQASQAFWEVPDIAREVSELERRGVVFEDYDVPGMKADAHHIATGGDAKAAWFKDPDGNILAVIETDRSRATSA
jgi:catechol 2,3-dioxygenase-like lactoylglutathione lyase family enzyme